MKILVGLILMVLVLALFPAILLVPLAVVGTVFDGSPFMWFGVAGGIAACLRMDKPLR